MLNKDQILSNIEQLLPILRQYQQKGSAIIEADQKQLLRITYLSVNPGVQMDLGCSSCILHYLNQLLAYYEREKPKSIPAVPTEESTTEAPAPTNKKTRRKKK